MTEYGSAGFTAPVRETHYDYDAVRRLASVGFDTDGDQTIEETVSYEYDAGGRRTKLAMPGGLEVSYEYDTRGQLVSMTDWDGGRTRLRYDRVGRHVTTERPNGLRTRYGYDPASRLRLLRHTAGSRTLAHFAYEVDGRGNRTQALELLAHPPTTDDTVITYDDPGIIDRGTWTLDNGFRVADKFSAALRFMFFGKGDVSFTFGTGPDHSLFDVYIGGSLWQSYDGYADTEDGG
jgi:YD repeat-containing protein